MPTSKKPTPKRKEPAIRTAVIEISMPGIGSKRTMEKMKELLDQATRRLTTWELPKEPIQWDLMYKKKKYGEVSLINQRINL
jgi:hypothetical protein